jgi:hypothetical protein
MAFDVSDFCRGDFALGVTLMEGAGRVRFKSEIRR